MQKISLFTENPHNPSTYTEEDLQDLISKIINYPDFMLLRPIVYDPSPENTHHDKFIVLGGNKRYSALNRLATWTDSQMEKLKRTNPGKDFHWLETLRQGDIPDKWIISAESLSDEDKRAFVFADNKGYGETDFEFVTEEECEEWGFEYEEVPAQTSSSDTYQIVLEYSESKYREIIQHIESKGIDKEDCFYNSLFDNT